MAVDEREMRIFAERWLHDQQRFWEGFQEGSGATDARAAQAAWRCACEQWWQAVGSAVPQPLAAPVRAALDHSRLFMQLAAGSGPESVLHALASEALDARRLIDAGTQDAVGAAGHPRYLKACERMVALLARVATESLERVRARLVHERPATPREVYALYAQEIEARYREIACGDEFARCVGELVNAQVDVLAEQRAEPR